MLDRRQRGIDHQQLRILLFGERSNLFDLALAEQACWPNLAQFECPTRDDLDADRLGEPYGFLDPRLDRANGPFPNSFRHSNERAFAARYSPVIGTIEDAQPSSSACVSPARLSGWPGCMVEIAGL